jgi:hypothetical protein
MNKKYISELKKLNACVESVRWLKSQLDPETAWAHAYAAVKPLRSNHATMAHSAGSHAG